MPKRSRKESKVNPIFVPLEVVPVDDDPDTDLDEMDNFEVDQHIPDYALNVSESEEEYEKAPREFNMVEDEKEVIAKLPIKDRSGAWQKQVVQVKKESKDEDITESNEEQPKQNDAANKTPKVDYSKMTLMEKKNVMASASNDIMENPVENIDRIKALMLLSRDKDPIAVKLALISMLAVFKDIIPGYRIRPLTEKEAAIKVSKEVKKNRNYEQSMLAQYQKFLSRLEELSGKKCEDGSISSVAVKCFCELLQSVSHFNFSHLLVHNVTRKANSKRLMPKSKVTIGEHCCSSIEKLFASDTHGRTSLEAVKEISKFVKAAGTKVQPLLISTFLKLDLKADLKSKDPAPKKKIRKKDRIHLTRTQRKSKKKMDEVDKEMMEAEAIVSEEERRKIHTEILEQVFVTYFRILKAYPGSSLLFPVLRGISKFSSLISVSYFNDLLKTLGSILKDSEELSLEIDVILECVSACFSICRGQDDFVTLDLKEFYDRGYSILNKLMPTKTSLSGPELKNAKTVRRMVSLMFGKNNSVSGINDRIAAFARRITSIALKYSDEEAIMELVLCLQDLLRNCPVPMKQLLTCTEEECLAGLYRPDINEPDLCSPFSAPFSDLRTLKSKGSAVSKLVDSMYRFIR